MAFIIIAAVGVRCETVDLGKSINIALFQSASDSCHQPGLRWNRARLFRNILSFRPRFNFFGQKQRV